MSLTEKIIENAQALSESKQLELLDFAEYLREKAENEERKDWTQFSLTSAMHGLKDDTSQYSLSDLKEKEKRVRE